ncbi:hypothetical protein BJP40_03725 [Streptomyces sp. CC53]|nr:hypothetical protein BJP40_03725 [Streptomyces sp. CC53]
MPEAMYAQQVAASSKSLAASARCSAMRGMASALRAWRIAFSSAGGPGNPEPSRGLAAMAWARQVVPEEAADTAAASASRVWRLPGTAV